MKILVLHGPNMNMLGVREPSLYGNTTLEQLNTQLTAYGQKHDLQISTYQSNHEGMLIDMIQNSYQKIDYIVFNPAAFTHTSIAILDALRAVNIPFIEVHITHIAQREKMRQHSYFRPYAIGTIAGLGIHSYFTALDALKHMQHTTNNEEITR